MQQVVLCNKNTCRANDSQTSHETGEKYIECNLTKTVQMIFMNYISIIYMIKQMDWSAGCTLRRKRFYRDIGAHSEYLIYSALSNMYRFFILAFGLFSAKVLFFWAFSESALLQMCLISCTRDTLYFHFAFAQIPKETC